MVLGAELGARPSPRTLVVALVAEQGEAHGLQELDRTCRQGELVRTVELGELVRTVANVLFVGHGDMHRLGDTQRLEEVEAKEPPKLGEAP